MIFCRLEYEQLEEVESEEPMLVEESNSTTIFLTLESDEEEDIMFQAPLEFTVTDCHEACADATDEPLAFGAEAVEEAEEAPTRQQQQQQQADRKRKGDERQAPRHKTQRVAVVPQPRLHK